MAAAIVGTDDTIVVTAAEATVTLEYVVEPADEVVRFRVEPRVSWLRLSESEARAEFTGGLSIQLDVVASELAFGSHTGSVVLHTSVGDVVTFVTVQQGLAGTYEGAIEYETPRSLGRSPIYVEVREDAADVAIRLRSDRSPPFPLSDGASPTFSASVEDGMLRASVVQRYDDILLESTSASGLFANAVGREIELELEATELGALDGRFTEVWHGLLGEPFEAAGTIRLVRIENGSVPEFLVADASELPPPVESMADSARTAECAAMADALGITCDVADPGSLEVCARALRALGAKLETDTGLVTTTDGKLHLHYVEMTEACRDEAFGDAIEEPACVAPSRLHCAAELYGEANRLTGVDGLTPAWLGMNELVSDWAALAGLLLNDQLVEAFGMPYEQNVQDDQLENDIDDALALGITNARDLSRIIFDPSLLDSLARAPQRDVSSKDYQALRRLAAVLSRYREALIERARLQTLQRGQDSLLVAEELRAASFNVFVGALVLSAIAEQQDAPGTYPEFGQLANVVTDLSSTIAGLSVNADPLGLRQEGVSFLASLSTDEGTNFERTLAAWMVFVDEAVELEERAIGAGREFEQTATDLVNQLDSLNHDTESELELLCGTADVGDAYENCTGGELAVANNQIAQANARIDGARLAVDAVYESIEIEHQRMREVYGLREDEIAFVDAQRNYVRSQELSESIFGAISSVAGLLLNPTPEGFIGVQFPIC